MEDTESSAASVITHTSEKLAAEMDYSLLAVDMQKLLHISRAGVSENPPSTGHSSQVRACIKMNEMEDIADHKCSFCTGNYTAKEMLSKHMLRIHHKDVLNILNQYNSSHDCLKCPFCVYKLSEKHKKLFLLHLEKKHSFEFVALMKEHFSSPSQVVPAKKSVEGSVVDGDGKGSPSKSRVTVAFPLTAPSIHGKKGAPGMFWTRSAAVRRKLLLHKSFNLQQPNQIIYLKENARLKADEDSTVANLMWKGPKQFVCGRCQEAFSYNALLLDHINIRHRRPLKLVQPLYHCGLCTATFFKNKFLVRHCFHHHSPR